MCMCVCAQALVGPDRLQRLPQSPPRERTFPMPRLRPAPAAPQVLPAAGTASRTPAPTRVAPQVLSAAGTASRTPAPTRVAPQVLPAAGTASCTPAPTRVAHHTPTQARDLRATTATALDLATAPGARGPPAPALGPPSPLLPPSSD
jgi:hypothetical protein